MANPLILMVPEERIELSGAQGPADFESAAFTNFTTPAVSVGLYSNYPSLSIIKSASHGSSS